MPDSIEKIAGRAFFHLSVGDAKATIATAKMFPSVVNRSKFDEYFDDIEARYGGTISPAVRAGCWAAVVNLSKCLKGFKGDDKKVLLKEVTDKVMRGRRPGPPLPPSPEQQQIILCIGKTMGWGANLQTICSNFDRHIFQPIDQGLCQPTAGGPIGGAYAPKSKKDWGALGNVVRAANLISDVIF